MIEIEGDKQRSLHRASHDRIDRYGCISPANRSVERRVVCESSRETSMSTNLAGTEFTYAVFACVLECTRRVFSLHVRSVSTLRAARERRVDCRVAFVLSFRNTPSDTPLNVHQTEHVRRENESSIRRRTGVPHWSGDRQAIEVTSLVFRW